MPIRLLLADDNRSFLETLQSLLENNSDMAVAAIARDGGEAIRMARDHHPDVVVLDIRMPGIAGIEAARQIACLSPAPAVIMLSMHVDRIYVAEATRAGAAGFLSKTSTPSELSEAIRRVSRGDTCFQPLPASRR